MPQKLFIGRKISSETKTWLSGENIAFEEHQLIIIEFCEPDISLFSSFENKPKMWIISSQWAAKWLVKYQKEIGFKTTDSVICLSEKQKGICSGFAANISVSNQQNAVSLSKLAIEKYCGEQVICLTGNLSMNNGELEMKSLGNQFQKTNVYRNSPLLKKVEGEFDVYLFFSPSGAISFSESGNKILASAAILAIGPTTAKSCEEIFGREILISEIQEELAAVQFAVGLLKKIEIQLNKM